MKCSRTVSWVLIGSLSALPVFAQPAPSKPATSKAAPSAPPAAAPAPPPAPAGPPPLADVLTGEAKTEYEAAKLLYEDGDYNGASLKFQRAYELSKDPRLLWNRAAAEKNRRHYALVRDLVEAYLKEGAATIVDAERMDAESLIQMVSAFIGRLNVSVNQPGATISIDGKPVGKSPLAAPLSLDMGPHDLKVELPGYKTLSRSVNVTGGATATEDFQLQIEKHEGVLRIVVGNDAVIRVDGKMVGIGQWQGTVPSGVHSIEASAKGKLPYLSDTLVQDDQTATVRVTLQDEVKPAEKSAVPTWMLLGGAAVLAVGAGVGGYFLFKPDDKGPPAPTEGSIGTVELPFLR